MGIPKNLFFLRAMLFGTINDFLVYGNLLRYSIKGHCACPICEDNTDWIWLDKCHKNVFLKNRKNLPLKHHYRGWRNVLIGDQKKA